MSVQTVRGLLLLRGYSLTGWARKHGYAAPHVQMVLRGKRNGPKARRILDALRRELGL